jgi:hypothetical protein
MIFLKSFAFDPTVPSTARLSYVTDAKEWQDRYEAFLSSLSTDGQGYSHTRSDPFYVPEEETWRIDEYNSGHTMVRVHGLTSDAVHLVAVSTWWDEAMGLTATEEEFYSLAVMPLLVAIGKDRQENLLTGMLFLYNAVKEIKAIDMTKTVRWFHTMNGVNITVQRTAGESFVSYTLLIDMLPYESPEYVFGDGSGM